LKNWKPDSKRYNGAITNDIKDLFAGMDIPTVETVEPENRYMSGIQIMKGQANNGFKFGSLQKKAEMGEKLGPRSCAIIVECVSAVGRVLAFVVVFKREAVYMHWFS
jgi:hypothetical protein